MPTLNRILNAAKNSLIKGHHKPHCFSSFVEGKGYIGKSGQEHISQLKRAIESEIDNMGFAPNYAEPGYNYNYNNPPKGILFANWNYFPRNFDKLLEKAGYSVEWSDEWSTCEDCNSAFRTVCDSSCWTPSFRITESEILCLDCYRDKYDGKL